MALKYKIGDQVRIKSIDWYNENKTSEGCLVCGSSHINPEMICMLGKIATISSVEGNHYRIKEYGWNWTDEMIEGLVEEECPQDFIEKYCKSCGTQRCDRTKEFLDGCPHYNEYMCEKQNNDMEEETSQNAKLVSERFSEYVNPSEFKYAQDTITKMLLQGANIPNEYILKDENGNVINATKIVLEKKKKEYPKTYEECCDVLSIPSYYKLRYYTYIHNYNEYTTLNQLCSLQDKLNILGKLISCRDAYWKIAGEEMGLGKPWKPDWKNSEERRYCIVNIEGDINLPEKVLTKWILKVTNKILVFPTEEMRDAFYENFKELIESVKELL